MSPDERMLITQLFERLRGASTAQRDPDAEAFIRQQIAQQPHAPYAMAQTIVAQTKALEATQERIRQLEAAPQQPAYRERDRFADERPMGAPGFGAQRSASAGPWNTNRAASQPAPQPSPWGQQQPMQGQPMQGQPMQGQPMQGQGGGGFLAGAMQTALGVAGGAMLFQGVSSMFGGGSASAAENGADKNSADDTADKDGGTENAADDTSGGDEGGGGFSDIFGGGDDGGGDIGGGDW